MKAPARLPKLCRHKASGRGYVLLDGRRHYLGRHGTPECREAYERTLAEWLANGRQLPVPQDEITISEVLVRYWRHAEDYYRRPDGSPSSELDSLRLALRPVKEYYGSIRAVEFGPKALKTVRQAWIVGAAPKQRRPGARTRINRDVHRIKRVFRWAAAEELIPVGLYEALRTVDGLRRGRSEARETEPVTPVPRAYVRRIRHHVSTQVRVLIDLQLLTGARPGELLGLRPRDFDKSNPGVWVVRPGQHKTAHRGHGRVILFGPKAQRILRRFLLRPADAFLFSPREAEHARRAALHAARSTALSCGNRPGSNRRTDPQRQPGDCYTKDSYGAAIARACVKATNAAVEEAVAAAKARGETPNVEELRKELRIPRWGPHRLRHSYGTQKRERHGIEVAQTLLGHRLGSTITEVYAEPHLAQALEIAAREG